MTISSQPSRLYSMRPPTSDSVDSIKRRATLVDLVEPLAMVGGLAEHPVNTLKALQGMGSSLAHGDLTTLGQQFSRFEVSTTHPQGIAGLAYKNSLFVSTGVYGLVGGAEIVEGAKAHDKYLALMGGADLMAAGSECAFGLSSAPVAIGLGIASAVSLAALVLGRPRHYSHMQKVIALGNAASTIPAVLLQAGRMPVPATIAAAIISPAVMLYANSSWARTHIDQGTAWVHHHLPHLHHSPPPPAAASPSSP
jgi:hypothetical protein